ncbi:anaerobic benzoate catabolism transcriptional regulator [uncultured Ruminococcus sp.]|uniref:Helix-turn-helix transcriptional regulator n=1 Tax=Massiliimalia timonensis TaxID=1987501 RepID=A0A8J6TWK5_9FIRM|nr:helix-turn-helix transcriptional regulator [Massiliimalia timonensis]MBC8609880.1 helix-turn-helix transcriptional regulator [Massiliimalia timonensis]SCH21447.1 anaerobic benzoate catabolism transcriptional regulator [uncultured Ruminococcus sp.]SCH26793.1 anaerobic benzoate catabolism transcriptional regulator [uncultured Clostridium sp.]
MKKKSKIIIDEFDDNKKILGNLVRLHRETNEMTMEQLARQSQLSSSYIWQIEKGRKNITHYTLWCVAQALDIPSGQLLYGFTELPAPQDVCPLKHLLSQCSNCQKKDFQDCCFSTGSEYAELIITYINSILKKKM